MHIGIAHEILGINFVPPIQVVKRFGVRYASDALWEFPWSQDVLTSACPFVAGKTVAQTHCAFLGLPHYREKPLTVMRLHTLFPSSAQPTFLVPDGHPYAHYDFATREICNLRWYLFYRGIVPGSIMKDWSEQPAILPPGYEVPRTVEAVMFHLFYYDAVGAYLEPGYFGRSSDVVVGNNQDASTAVVGVPHHGSQAVDPSSGQITPIRRAISIATWLCAIRAPDLGIYASRKLP